MRVPLGGRRVRGYVVEVDQDREGSLKEILAISGDAPVFDGKLLESLRWAAIHYVGPLSVLLDKSAPPTLPSRPELSSPSGSQHHTSQHPVHDVVEAAVAGRRRPVSAFVSHWADARWEEMLIPVAASSRSALIVVPTVREAEEIAEILSRSHGERVVLVPDGSGSEVTRAWEKANSGAAIVVGTPRVAFWRISDLALGFVLEEGRRAMKDRQTPTVHIRDLMRTRSRIEGFGLVFIGPTPSVELIAAGAEVIQETRPWGLVEVVDRRDDPPGSGFLSERSLAALRSAVGRGERSFVFSHIRAADSTVRCTSCRAIRLCGRCGSHVARQPACPRCGAPTGPCLQCAGESFESMGTIPSRLVKEIAPRVGSDNVGEVSDDRLIMVGTERDLAGLHGLALAVAVDPDALIRGHNYRSSEEALRILARLVGSVSRKRGHRTILQTSEPETNLLAALKRGEPIPYLEGVLARRARDGFPPSTEMMAIESSGIDPAEVSVLLEDIAGGMALGPVKVRDRHRWLVQGDLRHVKQELRGGLQRLRDSGATIRVDVDPIDL